MSQSKDYFLNFFVITYFIVICYFQITTQHWTAVPDQETVIIYNSLLVANNIQQEYLDHPSYSLFLVNAIVLKILDFIGLIKIDFIKEINLTEDFDNKFQSIFYVLKIIHLIVFLLSIFIFKKIMKNLNFSFHQILISILIILLNYYTLKSFFLIRSEPIAILFFLMSFYYILIFNREQKLRYLFLFSMFMTLSILSKMQLYFNYFFLFLFLLTQCKNYKLNNIPVFFKNYKYVYLLNFFIIFIYLIFITLLSYSDRFNGELLPEKYLIYAISIVIFYLFFIKNLKINDYFFKINQILLLIFISIFVTVTIFLLLDFLNLYAFNPRIILRLFLPLYYMLIFVNESNAYSLVLRSNEMINLDLVTLLYFISIFILGLIYFVRSADFKTLRNYNLYFYLYLMIIFVFLSFFFRGAYFYLIIFSCLILSNYLLGKKSLIFHYIILFVFAANITTNFHKVDKFFNFTDNINNICVNQNNIRSYMKYWHQRFDDKFLDKFCDVDNK